VPEEYKCKKCGVEFIRAQVCPECAEKLLENIFGKQKAHKERLKLQQNMRKNGR